MEELHNTEVLDREILEDARKKAHRILKAAEDTVKEQTAAWEKKTRQELETLRRQYAERLERSREEILARLPLDKRRLRSEAMEFLLRRGMKQFLEELSRESLLSVLTGELRFRLEACAELDRETQRPRILYRGLSAAEALGIFKQLGLIPAAEQPPAAEEEQRPAEDLAFIHGGSLPGVLIETPQVRISVSVDAAAETLLEDKRAELAAALLGEGALDD
ncbi:MAG: ATPase [Treponema sp.]|jgi:vacuolar-type H+-ATPase subunit H|nr:ATPase [Treponema sp.]